MMTVVVMMVMAVLRQGAAGHQSSGGDETKQPHGCHGKPFRSFHCERPFLIIHFKQDGWRLWRLLHTLMNVHS